MRHLSWRVRLFATGALMALVGLALENELVINVAIGVLIVGFLLRFVPERGESDDAG